MPYLSESDNTPGDKWCLKHRTEWGNNPDSKVRGANMGPICGRQDPGGSHVDPLNFVISETTQNQFR